MCAQKPGVLSKRSRFCSLLTCCRGFRVGSWWGYGFSVGRGLGAQETRHWRASPGREWVHAHVGGD